MRKTTMNNRPMQTTRQPMGMDKEDDSDHGFGDTEAASLSNTADEMNRTLRECLVLIEQIDGRLFGDKLPVGDDQSSAVEKMSLPLAAHINQGCDSAARLAKKLNRILDRL
jgi:hypothetical protein